MRRRATMALVLWSGLLLAERAGAQDIRDLERRVDLAVARRDEAAAALRAWRESRVSAPRVFRDTVMLAGGAIRVVTDAEFTPLVRRSAAIVERFVLARAGTRVAELRGTTFGVWSDSARRAQHGFIIASVAEGRTGSEHYFLVEPRWLVQTLEDHVQWALGTRDRPALQAWLGGGLPRDSMTNADWRAIRLELISGTAVARRCFDGAIDACKVTLSLTQATDPATAWYDSSARRAIVENARGDGRLDPRLVASCRAGHDGDCAAVLRDTPMLASWLASPGSARARYSLVQHAFAMGGNGALVRLGTAGDSPSAALAAIAGASVDSVVMQWRRHAHDGAIESESATPVIALVALGWFLVMGGLASRSPRWR